MKKLFLLFIIFFGANVFAQESNLASTRRIGIFAGSNNGGHGRAALRWAEQDARAVSQIFAEMGGIAAQDNIILANPTLRQINDRIERVTSEILKQKDAQKRTEIIFYYSGHSDEAGLLLGRETLSYKTLRDKINAIPADMRIVILDSCWSGAFTRAKGGQKTQAFLLDDQAEARGHAFLTSSSANEVSQESDAIRGSFFTHSLLAGLRGSASSGGNGRVTLNEAYRYAYDETLRKTESTLFGRQHPSYDIQISGTGDVVLTDVRAASAGLVVAENINGRLSIRDGDGFLVAELTKTAGKQIELGLPPGKYRLLIRRQTDMLQTALFGAEVTLEEGKHGLIEMKDFSSLTLEEAIARGDLNETGGLETDFIPENNLAENNNEELINNEEQEEITAEPFRIEFVPGLGSGRREKTRNNILLGILIGQGYDLEGIGVGSIGIQNKHNVDGMQAAGIYNYASNDLTGAQFAGIGNLAGKIKAGAQFAGIFNRVNSIENGAQFAGIFNWSGVVMHGAQFAGIFNWSGKDEDNSENSKNINTAFAGIFNWTADKIKGAQFAGLFNFSGGGVEGAQIAGIANISYGQNKIGQIGLLNIMGEGGGRQVGLLNIAFNENTKAFGIVNIVKNGLFNPAVYYGDLNLLNLSLKSGHRKFYSIARLGISNLPDRSFDIIDNEIAASIGFGREWQLGKIFFDLDISYGNIFAAGWLRKIGELHKNINRQEIGDSLDAYHKNYADYVKHFLQARFSSGYQIFKHLSIFGGVSYNFIFAKKEADSLVGNFLWEAGPFTHGISFFAGIQF